MISLTCLMNFCLYSCFLNELASEDTCKYLQKYISNFGKSNCLRKKFYFFYRRINNSIYSLRLARPLTATL